VAIDERHFAEDAIDARVDGVGLREKRRRDEKKCEDETIHAANNTLHRGRSGITCEVMAARFEAM
jgi:hypothetical protein